MQSVTCPACGAESRGDDVCQVCGTSLGGNPAGAATRPDAPADRWPEAPSAPTPARPSPAPPRERSGQVQRPGPPAASTSGLVGVVRGLRERSEQRQDRPYYIVTFRVERYGQGGEPLRPVPVEIGGRRLDGVIQEGDWVELPESGRPGETLQPRRVRNLSTGSDFGARGDAPVVKAVQAVILGVFLVVILGIWFFVAKEIVLNAFVAAW